jgi:hypothetical protein
MTNTRWRAILAGLAGVCAFLLLQPQVQAIPVLAIAIGAANIFIAAVNVPDDPDPARVIPDADPPGV